MGNKSTKSEVFLGGEGQFTASPFPLLATQTHAARAPVVVWPLSVLPPPHSAQASFSLQGSASGQGFLPALLAPPLMSTGPLTEVSFVIVILFFSKIYSFIKDCAGSSFPLRGSSLF